MYRQRKTYAALSVPGLLLNLLCGARTTPSIGKQSDPGQVSNFECACYRFPTNDCHIQQACMRPLGTRCIIRYVMRKCVFRQKTEFVLFFFVFFFAAWHKHTVPERFMWASPVHSRRSSSRFRDRFHPLAVHRAAGVNGLEKRSYNAVTPGKSHDAAAVGC